MHPITTRRSAAVVSSRLAVVALGACGSDDDLGPQAYEVVATDYAFAGVPDEAAAGSTLTLVDESSVELHEVVAIRLPENGSRQTVPMAGVAAEGADEMSPLSASARARCVDISG